jgi:hypothetical protein
MAAVGSREKRAILLDLQKPPTWAEWFSEKTEPRFEKCVTAGTLNPDQADYNAVDLEDPEISNEFLREACFRRDGQCCESLCASTGMRCHKKATKRVTVRAVTVTESQRVQLSRAEGLTTKPAIAAGDTMEVLVCDVHYRAMLRAQHEGIKWEITRFLLEAGAKLAVNYVIVPQIMQWVSIPALVEVTRQAYPATRVVPRVVANYAAKRPFKRALKSYIKADAGAMAANALDEWFAPSVLEARALGGLNAPSAPAFLTGRPPEPGLLERREAARRMEMEEETRKQLKRGREGEDIARLEAEKDTKSQKYSGGKRVRRSARLAATRKKRSGKFF